MNMITIEAIRLLMELQKSHSAHPDYVKRLGGMIEDLLFAMGKDIEQQRQFYSTIKTV